MVTIPTAGSHTGPRYHRSVAHDRDELLGLLFQHSPIPQFVSASDGSVVVANPAYADLVGSTPEEVVGSTPADIAQSLQKVAAIGYRAVQLSALGPIDPKELRRILDGEGLVACAAHVAFPRMRD